MTVARCSVPECTRRRPAERLMCGPHWHHVPRRLQRDVWSAYRQAEAAGVKPMESPDYVKAARAAIDAAKRGMPAFRSLAPKPAKPITEAETRPDWSGKCENCGDSPTVPVTGLCGPCTFGEADTAGGNW